MAQALLTQLTAAFGKVQTLLQAPQLLMSLVRFFSQPSRRRLLLQSA